MACCSGSELTFLVPPPQPLFSVLYEGHDVVVVEKPARVAMDGDHRAVSVATWATSYMTSHGIFSEEQDALEKANKMKKQLKFVHQLDFATSGILCLAFSKYTAARLAHHFEMRTTRKWYLALLDGALPVVPSGPQGLLEGGEELIEGVQRIPIGAPQRQELQRSFHLRLSPEAKPPVIESVRSPSLCNGTGTASPLTTSQGLTIEACFEVNTMLSVDIPIGKDESDEEGFRMALHGSQSRSAQTSILVLESGTAVDNRGEAHSVTKVLLMPHTGRRHQLRLHTSAALGLPILGEDTYGVDEEAIGGFGETLAWPRLCLHAWRLGLPFFLKEIDHTSGNPSMKASVDAHRKRMRREQKGIDDPTKSVLRDGTWTLIETADPFPFTLSGGQGKGEVKS